jgi:hypothetical protein
MSRMVNLTTLAPYIVAAILDETASLDIPFRILNVTTLLSSAHYNIWLSEAPSMEYREVSRLWARVRCARTFPEMTDETGI